MSDFVERAISDHGTSHSFHLKPNAFLGLPTHEYTDLAGMRHLTYADGSINKLQLEITVSQQPQNSVASDLLDSGILEFRINAGSVDILTHAYVKLTILNNTAGNVQLLPSQLLISSIQLFGQDNNDLLYRMEGTEAWLDNVFLSRVEFENMAALLNSNNAYSTAGNIIPTTESRDYYIPILRLLAQGKLNLRGIAGELILRINFNSSAINIVAGLLPTVTSSVLLLRGYHESPAVSRNKLKLYASRLISFPYLHPIRSTRTDDLEPSTTYTYTLSSFRGLCAMIIYTLRLNPITSANYATYVTDIESTDFQDSGGQSLIGSYRITFQEARDLIYSEKFDNRFAFNSGFGFINFCQLPTHAYKTGANHGFVSCNGFNQISIRTDANLAANNYRWDFYGWFYSTSVIKNGIIRTKKAN